MSGVSGNFNALAELRKQLSKLPEVAGAVARRAAPQVTGAIQESFDAGKSVYGNPRLPGKKGNTLTLFKTGRLRAGMRFISLGTRLRLNLGAPYARYHIRRGILPRGGGVIPDEWEKRITAEAEFELQARLGRIG